MAARCAVSSAAATSERSRAQSATQTRTTHFCYGSKISGNQKDCNVCVGGGGTRCTSPHHLILVHCAETKFTRPTSFPLTACHFRVHKPDTQPSIVERQTCHTLRVRGFVLLRANGLPSPPIIYFCTRWGKRGLSTTCRNARNAWRLRRNSTHTGYYCCTMVLLSDVVSYVA